MMAGAESVTGINLDLKSICRICLDEGSESTDLFCESEESLEILRMIMECFQIILNSDIYLPCVICVKCVEELKKAYAFRNKCVTINERFKDYCKKLMKNPEDLAKSSVTTESIDDGQSFYNDLHYYESSENIVINDILQFECDVCHKKLKSLKSLQRHKICMHERRRHVGRVSGFGHTREYHCTSCSYSTPHSQTLVNHMRTHNGERPFKCECGKNFTQASSLAAHRKTHSNTSHFTCPSCGKQFKHAHSLKTHLQVHENGKYCCSICNKVLKSKATLQSHMRRHYKLYHYNCEDCGITFITSAELRNHRLKHSAKKTIECHICSYTTNMKKNLIVHLKRHVGDKPLKCSFCDKAFYTKSDLRRHMRVHTREKPFSCQSCGQRFAYSSNLNKHMLIVHKIKYRLADHIKLKVK